ncbi:MAG: formylmethanofuran dehydrogenase subunit A [Candidatus Bathyarchaeota archaeon]|nr:formylmethanofuran dehydrogenase subunit A [Candidatus Bathyarchaeota archaeon]
MTELIVKNGFVYDPLNRINGEKMDICIRDGKIVESVKDKANVVDASGMVVMPGGIDIHSHIAGGEVDSARLLRPEDHVKDVEVKTALTRSGVGYSLPSTFTTGYRYSKMGYTTVMNPSMAPLQARHTHEELSDTPMIDKATYPLIGDWWISLEHIRDGLIKENAAHIAWMLKATRGYAIKLVNPGGLEAWGFGRNVHSIDDPVPNFGITPREIIRGLCKVNTLLNLPHTIHLHTNNLGQPGNYVTALESMKCVEDLAREDRPIMHITHIQFCAFKGADWRSLSSGAEEISNYMNNHSHVTLDMGQVVFSDTTTLTADGPFQYGLYHLSGNKWVNHDVETETSGGIVPFRYKRSSAVHATQWSIALEIALLIEDPWKILMTTDHPNGGPFTSYPKIMAWLISKGAREKVLSKINKRARKKSLLPSIDRELSLYELAVVTRAGQAKALGLKQKGHLGVGADADIAIYNINPERADPSKKFVAARKAFKNAAYTIKSGEIVVKDGEIVKPIFGKTYWLDVKTSMPKDVNNDIKKKFKEYWTVEYENYPIRKGFLSAPAPITVKAEV